MGRILSIDYGLKRVGIAATDPMQIIANSLATVETKNILEFLSGYLSKEKVDCIVVGLPKQMNNTPSESMKSIEAFVEDLKKRFTQVRIEYFDERFTSKLAVQAMVQGGVKKKDRRDKALIDSISATIILQSYLENHQFKSGI